MLGSASSESRRARKARGKQRQGPSQRGQVGKRPALKRGQVGGGQPCKMASLCANAGSALQVDALMLCLLPRTTSILTPLPPAHALHFQPTRSHTHSTPDVTIHAAPIIHPLRLSTPWSHATVSPPSPSPSCFSAPSTPSPTFLPPDHAPRTFSHTLPVGTAGRAAISRQSMMCATVLDPPEYSRRLGAVNVERSGGRRRERVR